MYTYIKRIEKKLKNKREKIKRIKNEIKNL
jgi:hypothetical protein